MKPTIPTTVTSEQLCDLLGIKLRRLQQLVEEGVLVKEDGRFDLKKAVRSYVTHNRGGDARAEQVRLKNDLLRLKYDRERGALVSEDDMARLITRIVTSAKQRLLSIPSNMAQRCAVLSDPNAIEESLRLEIHAALAELSKSDFSK